MPRLLSPGDRIRVVAPAGPVPAGRLDAGLAWLRGLGLDVVEGDHLRATHGHGLNFLAGDDNVRRADVVAGLLDPATHAVIAARGGDGTPRLLDDMPWDRLATVPPTIIAGLSDITCLHQATAARLGWATLWSPMPGTSILGGDEPDGWSRAGLASALGLDRSLSAATGQHAAADTAASGPMRDRGREPLRLSGTTLRSGPTVTAPLVGGSLALLSAMVGTPGFQPATGAIAILEDVGERAYRLERFLTHLVRAGFFDGCLGVAFGDLTDCGPPDQVAAVVADIVDGLGLPAVGELKFGHGPRQASLWLGRPATLDPIHATLTQSRGS